MAVTALLFFDCEMVSWYFTGWGTKECDLQDGELYQFEVLFVVLITKDPQIFPVHTIECFVHGVKVSIVVVCIPERVGTATL